MIGKAALSSAKRLVHLLPPVWATTLVLILFQPPGVAARTVSHALEFDPGKVRWERTPAGDQLGLVDLPRLRETGRAALPFDVVHLALPHGFSAASAQVMDARWHDLGTFQLQDNLPLVSETGLTARQTTLELAESDATFPRRPAALAGTAYLHGFSLATVRVFPLRQGPQGGVQLLVSGRLVVHLEPTDVAVCHRSVAWPGSPSEEGAIVSRLVANPSGLAIGAPPSPTAPSTKTSLDPGPAEAAYVIVTSEALAEAFQPLVEDKRRRGWTTETVTLEWIVARTRQGADLAETVRTFLQDAYARRGTRFVLLGGDVDVVPTRYARSRFHPGGGHTDIPTDLYFACLDGNWNADGDGVWGEAVTPGLPDSGDAVDLFPELAVGRAPVSSPEEVATFVSKVLQYEDPAVPSAMANALFLAEVLFPAAWNPGDTILVDGASLAENIIHNSMSSPGTALTPVRFYENHEGFAQSLPLTKSSALGSMQSGAYGIVTAQGHGFTYNLSVGDANIFPTDVDGLSNGPSYFVLSVLSCTAGAFDSDCLLERFLENPAGGSVASLGATREAFPVVADPYQQAFFEEVYRNGNTRLGEALNASRLRFAAVAANESVERWTQFTTALLGDPELQLWRRLPVTAVAHHPASVLQGQSHLVVHVEQSGLPAVGVNVTILQESGLFESALTNLAGDATLPIVGADEGDLSVWVSGANLLPSESQITVQAAAPSFAVRGEVIDDDQSGRSLGNGDGRFDAGELIEWRFQFENNGDDVSPAASATLTAVEAAGITLADDTITIPSMQPGQEHLADDAFVLLADHDVADGAQLEFLLTLDAGGESWIHEVQVTAFAPMVEIVRLWVDDAPFGNGDGVIQAGESLDVRVELKNFGLGQTGPMTGSLAPSPNVTIFDASDTWPSLELKEHSAGTAGFRLSEVDPSAENLFFLQIDNAYGRLLSRWLELRPPLPPQDLEVGAPQAAGTVVLEWATPPQQHWLGGRVYRAIDSAGPYVEAADDIVVGISSFTDTELPALTRVHYYVTSVDSSGVESTPSDTVSIATAPPELTVFPLTLGEAVSGALAVGDVQGNGDLAVVVGSDLVYAFDSSGAELTDGDSNPATKGPLSAVVGPFTPAGLSLANVDGLPGVEVLAGSWGRDEFHVLTGNGTAAAGWPRPMLDHNWGTPAAADLDLDGRLEIVVVDVSGRTYAWKHDGTDFFDGDANPATVGVFHERPGEWFNRATPALVDLDGDGRREIVHGTNYRDGRDNVMHAFRFDGTEASGWPVVLGPAGYQATSVTVADLNDDGETELIFLCDNDSLYVWTANASNFPGYPRFFESNAADLSSLTPIPAVGDFDQNGDLELVLVSVLSGIESLLYILDHDGSTWPGWPQQLPGLSEGSPVVADLDGDGSLDVVFGIGGGAPEAPNLLYAFQSDGTTLDGFPVSLLGPVRCTPTIADFDGDGDVDVLFAGFDRLLHVWDLPAPWDPNLAPWATFHGNPMRTGVAGEIIATTVAPSEHAPQARTLHVGSAAPNPFNAVTQLEFVVRGLGSSTAMARADVFDSAGRRVQTLVDGLVSGTSHAVRWDGRTDSGGLASSGVYYLRITVAGESATRKAILLK